MTTEQYIKALKKNFDEALQITINKNKDYADKDNPFKNFQLSAQVVGISVEKGILIRMMDKMTRISNLLERKEVITDEKIHDTLQDLKNYANILDVYLENK